MQMDISDMMMAQQAETLRLSGAYEQAIEIFEQLQMYPDNAWVNAHLGATYYHLMDYGKAKHYLKKAIDKNDKYFWAHAQLGETYRLRAITENNRRPEYVEKAIEHFQKALDSKPPEDSNYVWALAHLGATHRLYITKGISQFLHEPISQQPNPENSCGQEKIQQHAEDALKCLNRAIELMPTYAWAWGMRSTVYRLTQDYENSFWDLGVEAVIAPSMEIMQQSSSPVPFLKSGRVNLYEHAFLSFYLTKKHSDPEDKKIHYIRAIAFLQQALILSPGDLMAKLILTIIEANQKKEERGSLKPNDIKNIQRKLEQFFEDTEVEFCHKFKKVLRHQINVPEPSVSIEQLKWINSHAEEGHKLKKLVLEDVIKQPDLGVKKTEAQLWLWENFALTEMWSYILFFLAEVSHLLGNKSNIGTETAYLELAFLINPYYVTERLHQTPVFSHQDRTKIFKKLHDDGIVLKFSEPN
ncbi:tetratricopeptide repeat protein [Microcoleus vaginatus GB1-A3]